MTATDPPQLREGVSVLVPTYRSAGHLAVLADQVGAVLDAASVPYELILVDDGSNDGTWEEARALASTRQPVRGLRLSRNYGQQNALLAGLRAAGCERVVTLDDDLQYRPESIPPLLAAMDEGADLVYGRAERPRHGALRGFVTRVSKWLMRLVTGEPMIASISALRGFRTDLRSAFDDFDGPYVSLDALLLWSTNRVGEIEVPHDPRTHGSSGYSLRSLIRLALTITVGFSSRPLRAASVLGFACTALGIGLLVYVLIRYTTEGGSVPGFAFLASAISIFSGAQLFAIGVIGEYLARMYPQVMGRPSYSVAERAGD